MDARMTRAAYKSILSGEIQGHVIHTVAYGILEPANRNRASARATVHLSVEHSCRRNDNSESIVEMTKNASEQT